MKFIRILAVVISSLMLVSVMRFAVNVSAQDNGVIKENVLDEYVLYRGKSSTKMFDKDTGIGFARLVPDNSLTNGTKASYVNMQSQNILFTPEQAKNCAYIVFYARTNMDIDENDIPRLEQYYSYYGTAEKHEESVGMVATLITNGYASQISNVWQKFCFKLVTQASIDLNGDFRNETANLYKWDQVAFFPVGNSSGKPINEWYEAAPAGQEPYVDFAGYAIVDSLEAAAAYDFTKTAPAPKVTVNFDTQTAQDDSDIIKESFVYGDWNAAGCVEFPELIVPDGKKLVGWSTTADASGLIVDPTTVKIPQTETTYYAIWREEVTINFHKNDGTQEIFRTYTINKGTAIADLGEPERTGYRFLGWSESEDGEAVEVQTNANKDYYAIWGEIITITFSGVEYGEYEYIVGEEIAPPTVPAQTGCKFLGWAIEGGEVYTFTTATSELNGLVFYPVFDEDTTTPYYNLYGEYNKMNSTYTVDVKIINGEFTVGTVGGKFNKDLLTFTGYELGNGISNNLLDAPKIVKDSMYTGSDDTFVLVWEAFGNIDATEEEATIITFYFDVKNEQAFEEALENDIDAVYPFIPQKDYEKYFQNGQYLVSPKNTSENPYAVEYVSVYFGELINTETTHEKAAVTFNVTFASKIGTTIANIGELILFNDDMAEDIVYTIDSIGNEYATVTKVTYDFYSGHEMNFNIRKNGYISAANAQTVIVQDDMTINITLVAGDIKGSEGDFCGDGKVTLEDFVRVIRAFDDADGEKIEAYREWVDLDESGTVTVQDLGFINTNYNFTAANNIIEYVYAE